MSGGGAGRGRGVAGGLLIGLWLLGGCATPPGGTEENPNQVPRPEWRVGDRWVFRRTSLSGTPAVVTHKVTAATADGYTLRVLGVVPEVVQSWTLDLHLRRHTVGDRAPGEFELPARYFTWPLTLGKSWTQEFVYGDGTRSGTYANTWRVGTTVEQIQVVGGVYYALRIERRGSGGERLDTYWYTPKVRYWVRLENYQGGYTDELVDFTPTGA